MTGKVLTMKEAVARYVDDGDVVAAEGFTHLIPFAAGHEMIRQKKRDLVLCRLTPDLIYDQMIAAGLARKLVFGWIGNPGVGSLHAVRRAVEDAVPHGIELEEYSHFGLLARLEAGASGVPCTLLRNYHGTDLPNVNANIRFIECPFTGELLAAVPALRPDVAIIHAQRADASGNTQAWGLLGVQKEAAFAAKKVVVVVEEILDEDAIRSDPNRTLVPGIVVDAVVEQPFGAHPSYAQGLYDRDNDFYVSWDAVSRSRSKLEAYLDEWVHGVSTRAEYVEKLGADTRLRLTPEPGPAPSVDYGWYR